MAIFNKPQFNTVWAANGAKQEPDVAKVSLGWVAEIPPHEYANWLENRRDAMLAHVNQAGIPVWDATTEYQTGKSYVQGSSTGTIYRALTTNTAVNPELDVQGNWAVAFQHNGESLLKSQNLADVPDKVQARNNLGIATTSDYDSRYLIKVNNLADVPNKATARGNIDVYSKQEVVDLINNLQPAGEVTPFARDTAPTGWLVCDGALVSRTTYARLFSAIGTRFGAGNGSTTFQLPDLRGEFIRGWDSGRGVDAGRVLGSWQDSENKVHAHAVNDPGHVHAGVPIRSQDVDRGNVSSSFSIDNAGDTLQAFTGITLSATGGNESRPRNVALLYCIRT